MNKKIFVSVGIVIFSIIKSAGQDYTDLHWKFGNTSNGIDFDKGNYTARVSADKSVAFSSQGGLVVADPLNGNILFYTDGNTVYDRDHQIVPNGMGLSAMSSASQRVVGCPVPGSQRLFYIFTYTDAEIQYSLFDREALGNASVIPAGVITSKNESTLFKNPSGAVAIIPSADRSFFWLLGQNKLNRRYQLLKITSASMDTSSFSFENANNPSLEAAGFSFFSLRNDSLLIAVAPKTAQRNIQILSFKPSTGKLAFVKQLFNTAVSDGITESIFGVEWSFNGSQLYYSRYGSSSSLQGKVYQYDIQKNTSQVIFPNPKVSNGLYRSFGLKKAPDRNIYHIYQESNGGAFFLGIIKQADSTADKIKYEERALFGNAGTRAMQFSVSAPPAQFRFQMSFQTTGICQKNTTVFFPDVSPNPESVRWAFGDGENSLHYAPIHEYQNPGTYTVRFSATLNGYTQTLTQVINIASNDIEVNLKDTTVCIGESVTLDATPSTGSATYSYLWSTGATTATAKLDSAATYWVKVINTATSCYTVKSFEVKWYGNKEQKANIWYFGERAGINFNKSPAIAIADANKMTSPQGCATISDINGKLLFYTNGSTVWNKKHRIMENGTKIGGDSTSAQSSLIIPIPDNKLLYYIITTQSVYGEKTFQMSYTLVDMSLDSANGGVISKNKRLFSQSTERLTAQDISNTIWIIAHEYGNNNYRAYFIDKNGIANATISTTGRSHAFSNEKNGKGFLTLSPNSDYIATTIPNLQDNFLEIAKFNTTNGRVDSAITIDISEPLPSEIYGLAFSPNGSNIYITTKEGTASKLIQFGVDTLTAKITDAQKITAIQNTKYVVASEPSFGAIQIGPDKTMYIAKDNGNVLATINNPEGQGANVTVNPMGITLAGGTSSRLGLPSFIYSYIAPTNEITMDFQNGCLGRKTQFIATESSDIDKFKWFLPDTTVSLKEFEYAIKTAGTFTIRLQVTNRCLLDTTLQRNITINVTPEKPQITSPQPICNDNGVILSAWNTDVAGQTYQWSTGETTRQITVTTPSTLQVSIINAMGCYSDTVEVRVIDVRPTVDLGSNTTICQGDTIPDLDADLGDFYIWYLNGAENGNKTRKQPVNTQTTGIFEYGVLVTDTITKCSATSKVAFTINPKIQATASTSNAADCGQDNGMIHISLQTIGDFSYTLSGAKTITTTPISNPPTNHTINNLLAGTYQLQINNPVSQCKTSFFGLAINSNIASFKDTIIGVAGCQSGIIKIKTNIKSNYSFQIISSQIGRNITPAANTFSGDSITIPEIPFGTYTVQVTRIEDNCIVTKSNIAVLQSPQPQISFNPTQTICTAGKIFIIPANKNITITWKNSSGNTIGTGDSIAITSSGTYTVEATISAISCKRIEKIEAIVTPPPSVTITTTGDSCLGTRILNAVVSPQNAIFSYAWNNGAITQQITITEGGNYTVRVRDNTSSCRSFASKLVQVYKNINLSLTQTPNCSNQNQVTLTANTASPSQTSFVWKRNNKTISDTIANINVDSTGDYTVIATHRQSKCIQTQTITANIIIISDTAVKLPQTAKFCSLDPINPSIEVSPGEFNTYQWKKLPESIIIGTQQKLKINQAGVYQVIFTNGSTCRRSVITVFDDCSAIIYAPTAFSPDAQGLVQNETFSIFPNSYVKDFSIFIYNKWGELVYFSNDVTFKWNGEYHGKLLPTGSYVYKITYNNNVDTSKPLIEQRGIVKLIR